MGHMMGGPMGPNMGPMGHAGMGHMGPNMMGPNRMVGPGNQMMMMKGGPGQMGQMGPGMGPMDGFPGGTPSCGVMDGLGADGEMPWDTVSLFYSNQIDIFLIFFKELTNYQRKCERLSKYHLICIQFLLPPKRSDGWLFSQFLCFRIGHKY